MRNLILLATLSLPLAAQQPQIQNGQFTTINTTNPQAELKTLEQQNDTTWLAYNIPTTKRIHSNWRSDEAIYLEGDHSNSERDEPSSDNKTTYHALVLLRVADHNVQKIRIEDPEQKLDAGNTHIAYLPTVDAEQSIALLKSLAEQPNTSRLRDSAIFAISIHQSPATVPTLTALASPEHDLQIREKAAFWLSTQHGKESLPLISRWAREDKDERFREKLVFDLTLIHEPAAAEALIRMAHDDPEPKVRKQAQFWMANIGGKRVLGDLGNIASNDPNTEVRKSAVFALSRMPNNEGTPRLIELAQTSKDPGVRKQAVFWLGQSKDPRALDYLTQLIQH